MEKQIVKEVKIFVHHRDNTFGALVGFGDGNFGEGGYCRYFTEDVTPDGEYVHYKLDDQPSVSYFSLPRLVRVLRHLYPECTIVGLEEAVRCL